MSLYAPRRTGYGLAAIAIVLALGWLALRGRPDGRLHVYFLDVGQGDAILVQTPEGRQFLIDGGPSPAALLSELGQVMPFWDRTLDAVVLTHPDQDHLTGLLAALERYQVEKVLDNGCAGSGLAAEWRERMAARPGHTVASAGLRVAAGDALFTVLSPPPPEAGEAGPGCNNDASLVMRLDYGHTSVLLAGDAEEPAEASLLAAGLPLAADVLKVSHHGSAGATSQAFLAAVKPRLAIIQVGEDNRFGHPAADTLARLVAIPALRTDRQGRIEVISDGDRLWVETAHP